MRKFMTIDFLLNEEVPGVKALILEPAAGSRFIYVVGTDYDKSARYCLVGIIE